MAGTSPAMTIWGSNGSRIGDAGQRHRTEMCESGRGSGAGGRPGAALPGRTKEAGRPEAARLSCPFEGTGQKPMAMPVTKAVPSTVPCSPEMNEVLDATPGASV